VFPIISMRQNIKITREENKTHIAIRKRYELALYGFLLFAFVFIVVVLFSLIPLAQANNPDSESNVLGIIQALFYIVGSIMFIGTVHELLKREWLEISKSELILGYSIVGKSTVSDRYSLKQLTDLQLAPLPKKGWKVSERYKDSTRQWTHYSNDIRRVYPTIIFQYKGEEVSFANGLKPEEANEVITIIKKHIANEN
jgi:hypothetical protein